MAEKNGTLLTTIDGLSPAAIARLADLWITTGEELVSAARQPRGTGDLAVFLGLSEAEVEQLAETAAAALPGSFSFAPDELPELGLGGMDDRRAEAEEVDPGPLSFDPPPASVNLIAEMPGVKYQGGRGTCVSFTVTAQREYWLRKLGLPADDLSEQHLYWNCKQHDGWAGGGTWIHIAMQRLMADGICREVTWPYSGLVDPANEGHNPAPVGAADDAAQYKILNFAEIGANQIATMRSWLSEGHPIAFTAMIYDYWQTNPLWTTGDIRLILPGDASLGGHAMLMVGYEDDESVPGGGYFLVRNSWGEQFASGGIQPPGYLRMPYAFAEASVYAAYAMKLSE